MANGGGGEIRRHGKGPAVADGCDGSAHGERRSEVVLDRSWSWCDSEGTEEVRSVRWRRPDLWWSLWSCVADL